jgi:hypothetical protein
LGIVERYLSAQKRELDLTIHEIAPTSWGWVEGDFSDDRKLTGPIPQCLAESVKFDLVYLATVDYALNDESLISLLAALRSHLSEPHGECLLISASFERTPESLLEFGRLGLGNLKEFVKGILDDLGFRSRGQFWGWTRNREEYRSVLERAGYRDIQDGFIGSETRSHYWIAGH